MIYAVYKWQKTEVVTNISLPQKRFVSHGIPPKKPTNLNPAIHSAAGTGPKALNRIVKAMMGSQVR